MKILLIIIIILSLISGLVTSFDAIGYSGGRLIIVIISQQWNSNSKKYICKSGEKDCKYESYTNIQDNAGNAGRFSFYKDSQDYFTMFIRDLDLQDEGEYSFGNELYWKINLRVLKDSCCVKSERVTGHLNGNVVIRCDYPEEHKRKWKYLYKLNDHRVERVIYCDSLDKKYHKKRFYIKDDTHSNMFTISISNVNSEDGGVYYCGVRTGEYPFYSIATIKTIYLNVTEKVASVRVSGFLGGCIMMECKHPEENHKSKFICKESQKECSEKMYSRKQYQWEKTGGFTVFDDTSRGSLMVFLRNVSEGTYRCGVDVSEFSEKYIEMTVEVMEDPCCGKTISQVGRIGETLKIDCRHPLTYKSNPKYFCKEEDDHICQDISSLRPAGKYSLSDHNQTGLFIVSVFNLTLSDAGVYWCGVETSEGDLRYTSLITKVQISIKFDALIGYEGDVVQIRCPYASNFKHHSKHFCKGNEEKECFTQQSNLQPSTQLQNRVEKFSLINNITAGVFTVTIRGLTVEDAGNYWCAVRTGDVLMKYLSIELKVIMKQELRVIGHVALNASINCIYSRTTDSEKKNNRKFFCMGKHHSICDQDGVKVSSERNRRGRFSLSDDASSGIFMVTITDLREEDSGTYWCGEESSGSAIYTKVQLQVTKDFPGFSPIIFITGSVSVVLLLIGGLILIFCKTRCTKTQGSSSSNRTDPTNNEEVFSAAHDYEEINHTTHRSRRNASSPNNRSDKKNTGASIYSTVQLPKEEGITYATVNFQKNPDSPSDGSVTVIKDDSSTEYAMIKHHSRRK